MLQPKRSKFLKQHSGVCGKYTESGTSVSFGVYGFKAIESGSVTAGELEAARRVLARSVKNVGKLWLRVFPDRPITKKPIEVRQGKGCGSVDRWVAVVNRGKIIFELSGLSLEKTKLVHKIVSSKLSVKTILCERLTL